MKRIKVVSMKVDTIETVKRGPTYLTEQEYLFDNKVNLKVSPGYAIVSITEYLPVENQCNEKAIAKDNQS